MYNSYGGYSPISFTMVTQTGAWMQGARSAMYPLRYISDEQHSRRVPVCVTRREATQFAHFRVTPPHGTTAGTASSSFLELIKLRGFHLQKK